ncbi:Smr/MutS family protein [Pseudooceanicola aestuarii]|uniref:Smr/MutS family protein n=1 Tax=Pseudooceanicola aestuarii TaxID=2697319 RepID=UPI0013D26886|nr:Smr/MutS family protein [Pseudooceanicola aestuarii]
MNRRLTSDELDLWRKVAERTERLHDSTSREVARPAPKAPTLRRREAVPQDMRIGKQVKSPAPAHDLQAELTERLHGLPLRMDRKLHGRMTRGKLAPEARIDLHGMTTDRAHTALRGFVLRCAREGMRLVLVITGKGRDEAGTNIIPDRKGVLRHQVPQWLSLPPLSHLVLQITPAHRKHGGHGAYYVYLTRNR